MNKFYLTAALLLICQTLSSSAQSPPFRAEGPLPVSTASYPFGAADHTRTPSDLKAVGYVEEEFLFSGSANVYDWPEPGPAAVRTAGAPYTTRILVRRPTARTRFSGTVIVEMLTAALQKLRTDSGLTMILVEQNSRVALAFCERTIVMDKGRIVYDGASSVLKADPGKLAGFVGVE